MAWAEVALHGQWPPLFVPTRSAHGQPRREAAPFFCHGTAGFRVSQAHGKRRFFREGGGGSRRLANLPSLRFVGSSVRRVRLKTRHGPKVADFVSAFRSTPARAGKAGFFETPNHVRVARQTWRHSCRLDSYLQLPRLAPVARFWSPGRVSFWSVAPC